MSRSNISRASLALLCLFVMIVVVQHVLQPQLGPSDHRVSEYATGSPGWLMTMGFAAWTLSLAAAGFVVARSSLQPRWLRAFLSALLTVAATGTFVTAAFETGTEAGVVPAGRVLTTEHRLHDLGSGAAGLVFWIASFLSLGLADRRLRRRVTMLLTAALVVAAVLSGALLDLPGARQRSLLAVACLWQALLLGAANRAR